MNDCPDVEIRELLPDYLSGTLSASRRAEVDSHLATCADCADELAVLKLVREAYAQATVPSVNVNAIVAALPKKAPRRAIRSWRRGPAFQIAAAATFIALGGMSLAIARSFVTGSPSGEAPDTLVATTTMQETPFSFAGGLSDLGDDELEALISALESVEALPVEEPAEIPLSGNGRQGS